LESKASALATPSHLNPSRPNLKVWTPTRLNLMALGGILAVPIVRTPLLTKEGLGVVVGFPLSGSQKILNKLLPLAIQHYQAGQLNVAESICRQILQAAPDDGDAWHGLGIIAAHQGHYDSAATYLEQAITLHPNLAIYYNSLGNVYWYQGQLSQAATVYRQALALQPNYAEAYNGLGNVLSDQGQLAEAEHCYRQAVSVNPSYAQAYNGLGNVLKAQTRWREAITSYRQALTGWPAYAEAWNNLGSVLGEVEEWEEALNCCTRALVLQPNYAKAHNNLGNLWRKQFRFTEALAHYQQALTLSPQFAEAYSNLGNIWRDMGLVESAITCYRQALQLKPLVPIFSHLLFALLYNTEDLEERQPEYRAFDKFCQTLVPAPYQHDQHAWLTRRRGQSRLNIAYLTADLRRHSVAYFMESILAHHDHEQFQIWVYYDYAKEDEVTQRLRGYVDQWVNCKHLSHAALSERIHEDGIDILVEVMGHTGEHRLLVLAQQPAPIQMSYLGYSDTTGLSRIQYRLTDGYVEPLGAADEYSAEQLVRLPRSYFAYCPPASSPPVSPPPMLSKGYITFGSFNYLPKLSPRLLTVWARLLEALPTAHLLIKTNTRQLLSEAMIREQVLTRLQSSGLDLSRVTLADCAETTTEHLRWYGEIDIALDTYPYHGATTTCEALWMGVPVVTWAGRTHAGRMGLSILAAAGLPELIGSNEEDYLKIAWWLARNGGYLQELRQTLRERLTQSLLMDGLGLTREIEQVYRRVITALETG